MKTPISYYGGKQNLVTEILKLIPPHQLYAEVFCGGAAVFFQKQISPVEILNDTNRELINFYEVVKRDFISLEKEIEITLHSRHLHRKAEVIYNNPDMFNEVKRAWAVWVLSSQSFSAMLDGSWGYDVKKNTTSKKIANKRESFTLEYAKRLQMVQFECTDAIRIINSRDGVDSFFYCDPPCPDTHLGHYDGYTLEDFIRLLETLSKIKGKFLLSSYPYKVLDEFVKANGWHQRIFTKQVSVNGKGQRKLKAEVLTYNYVV